MKQKKRSSSLVERYNNFISQIDIDELRLVSAQVNVLDYSYFPSSADVRWRTKASYENEEEQSCVSHRYNATIRDELNNEVKAKISVTFYIVYSTKIPMTDDLFEIFKERNLPVNTWPYFREFVHNITARLGWPPYIAPTYVA